MLKELEAIGTEAALREYCCKVVYFIDQLSLLLIEIQHPKDPNATRYLDFEGVDYFVGPMFWRGAHFAHASDDVSAGAWRCVYPNLPAKRITQMSSIFPVCTVDLPGQPVVVAYGGLNVLDKCLPLRVNPAPPPTRQTMEPFMRLHIEQANGTNGTHGNGNGRAKVPAHT